MNDKRLIEKLRKVLALTDSPSEGEAQAAALHLERLLTKHNIDMAELELAGGAQVEATGESGMIKLGRTGTQWRMDLWCIVARSFYCSPLIWSFGGERRVTAIGRPSNTEATVLLYQWLEEQIVRIAKSERVEWRKRNGGAHMDGLRWQCSFARGANTRIAERFEERRAEADTTQALVVCRSAENKGYMTEHYPNTRPVKSADTTIDYRAYAEGKRAADKMSLARNIGGDSSSERKRLQ